MKEMWKPSKRLVTWILVILLLYNIGTLIVTLNECSVVYASPLQSAWYPSGDNLYVRNLNNLWTIEQEASWWTTEMNKIDNAPQMIVSFPRSWGLSSSDEISPYGFKFERVGNNVRLVETGQEMGSGGSIRNTVTYDWLKNFFVPWMLEKDLHDFWNEGSFKNLFVVDWNTYIGNIENSTTCAKWENLDFAFIRATKYDWFTGKFELSPWGPIHLLIVIGSLIYVRKRWD